MLHFTVRRLRPQCSQTWLLGRGGAAPKEGEWQLGLLIVIHEWKVFTSFVLPPRHTPALWCSKRRCGMYYISCMSSWIFMSVSLHFRWLTCTRWLQKCGRRGSQRVMRSTGAGRGRKLQRWTVLVKFHSHQHNFIFEFTYRLLKSWFHEKCFMQSRSPFWQGDAKRLAWKFFFSSVGKLSEYLLPAKKMHSLDQPLTLKVNTPGTKLHAADVLLWKWLDK